MSVRLAACRGLEDVVMTPDQTLITGAALRGALRDIVHEAERALSGVDGAAAAVHRGPSRVLVTSNALAAGSDVARRRVREGPALEAYRSNTVVVLDLGERDRRWPEFQSTALAAGARTVLAVPLRLDRQPIGSLNLYSRTRGAFSARTVREAELFARPAGLRLSHAGIAVHAVEAAEVAGLELQDRSTIECALGVLMAVHRDASPDHARARLEQVAAELGLDLPLAAARIVAAPPRPGGDA
jgi:GAF domain-containing protein